MQHYVSVGEGVTSEVGFLMGHGTRLPSDESTQLTATVSGFVERVNKLISVRAVNARYTPEIGDVIVGRVAEVGDKRWKVDICGRQDAILMLSAVNLPGGVQRRRTAEDSLQMRELFTEHDLISAEVQKVQHDGSVALHTRSTKYGKLMNGQFIRVPAGLIKRCKQHFHSLSMGVEIILGNNGYVWLHATDPVPSSTENSENVDSKRLLREVSVAERERVARVSNSIVALSRVGCAIHVPTIMEVYSQSIQIGLAAHRILDPELLHVLTQTAQALSRS